MVLIIGFRRSQHCSYLESSKNKVVITLDSPRWEMGSIHIILYTFLQYSIQSLKLFVIVLKILKLEVCWSQDVGKRLSVGEIRRPATLLKSTITSIARDQHISPWNLSIMWPNGSISRSHVVALWPISFNLGGETRLYNIASLGLNGTFS